MLARIKPRLKSTKERPWLWQGGPSYQPLAIVVCRDLPIEPIFYEWLVFAPFGTQAMREALVDFMQHGRFDLMEKVRLLNRKEFDIMMQDL